MHTAQLGDLVRIQFSRVPTPGAKTGRPPAQKVLEFTVGSSDITPSVSLGVVGMAQGDSKRVSLPPPEPGRPARGGPTKEKPRFRSPGRLDLRVGKRPATVQTASARPPRLKAAPGPDSRGVELEVMLISLDSSSNANKRRPQFDLGGES